MRECCSRHAKVTETSLSACLQWQSDPMQSNVTGLASSCCARIPASYSASFCIAASKGRPPHGMCKHKLLRVTYCNQRIGGVRCIAHKQGCVYAPDALSLPSNVKATMPTMASVTAGEIALDSKSGLILLSCKQHNANPRCI